MGNPKSSPVERLAERHLCADCERRREREARGICQLGVDWHQEQRTIHDPTWGDITVEVGQVRGGKFGGEFWIAPCGTPTLTSYPPCGEWRYLGGGRAQTGGT